VFGTKDRRDYAVFASGGFFTTGKDSIVVPIRFLNVSQERDSFYLAIVEAKVKDVPLMPDQTTNGCRTSPGALATTRFLGSHNLMPTPTIRTPGN
jgi:hypothetical protein